MESGGDQEEQKHSCRFCGKSFPCGRSLGGHMRSHVPANSPPEVAEGKLPSPPAPQQQEQASGGRGLSGFGGGVCVGGVGAAYGLRENPKKTWRVYESAEADDVCPKREKLCRECGKGFPTWRSLFGHMRCHSARPSHILRRHGEQEGAEERERVEEAEGQREEEEEEDDEESGSWYSGAEENDILATVTPPMRALRRRRSRRTVAAAAAISFPPEPSSSLSEIERELQDVAQCLMMLSRDVGFWGDVHSFAESSGKNAIVPGDVEGFAGEEKSYLKKERSAVGSVGFRHSINVMKKPKPKDYSTSETDWEDDSGDTRPRPRRVVAELGKRTGAHEADSSLVKDGVSKKRKFDEADAELGGDQGKACNGGGGDGRPPHKKSRFECTTCRKAFHSYQALGGHRASHKRIDARAAAKLDGGDTNSVDTGISVDAAAATAAEKPLDSDPADEVGRHECGICLKVFPSGQALGGHKRRHFAASSDDGEAPARRQLQRLPPPPPGELDLNLPAAPDEDSGLVSGRGGANPWWVGSRPPPAAIGAPLISGRR